jgi:hypothetical protein
MMTTHKNDADSRGGKPQGTQPQASGRTPAADLQEADAGTPASGAANQGSPAAPVMKQFQKTRAESNGRP